MPEDKALDSVSEEEPMVEVEEEVWEYVKPSEEAKVCVCNLPYNVSSECLEQLLGQAGVVQISKRAGVLEYGHELVGDVDGHEPVEPAEEPPAHEHRGQSDDGLVPGDRSGELGLVGDLVHGGVHPEPLQQPLHHVAEAAPAPPHHQHRALRHHPPHSSPAPPPGAPAHSDAFRNSSG
ncbi:hypothetical protein ZWY2020_056210 [Hordeum vulgare]|nr:hypothetical protein ZWY2020_056210 [Hordeum vulgare]